MLALNTTNNLVLGIDIGGSHISGIIANIGGEILYQNRIAEKWTDSEENFLTLLHYVQELQIEAQKIPSKILELQSEFLELLTV